MYKQILRFSILFIIIIFSSLSTFAATVTVSNTNDSGAGSLRQAVIDATSGDIINFSVTGTITLTSGEITINKNLTIIGPGSGSLAIDGNNASRIFLINSGRTVTIFGMTLQNGNTASDGGAIDNRGTLTINNSKLSGNHTTSSGGAINNLSGTLTINNSSLFGNIADAYSGAIRNYSTVTVNNSTISGNSAGDDGGAMYNVGTLTVNNSTISGNSAVGSGGGFRNVSGYTITINNSTISNNSATDGGGGIIIYGTVIVNNSIISGNTASFYSECWFALGTFNSDANNIFGTSGSNGGCTNGASDIVPAGAIGTILTGLANNGAPTQTHALVGGSPAINASGGGAIATDQRGVPAQGIRDIGAFEFGAIPTYPTVQFSSAGATYNETDGTVNIGLTISGASNFAGIAQVIVSDPLTGSATSGSDYTALDPQVVSIDCSGVTCPANTTVALSLLTDAILENDEIANLALIGTNGFATIGAQSTFAATIQDTTTSTATISTNDPDASEDPIDNGQFTVDLGSLNNTGSAITINYSIVGTAIDGTDYTTLSGSVDIADGQQTASIDIVPIVDATFEGGETVELTLTTTSNGSVSVDSTPATVTISDSTSAIATITANDPDASENPVDNGQFTVDLGIVNNTGTAITVNYSIAGTATNGTDYTLLTGSVDVADGQQTATIDLVPLDDNDLEGDETVELTLSGTSNASVSVDTTPAIVTIADDEKPSKKSSKSDAMSDASQDPSISIFDPAISKIGVLLPGQVGLVGEKLEWIITVTNNGNASGNNFVIVDNIIPALKIDDVSKNVNSTVNGQTVTVTLATLNAGQSVTYSIFTTVLKSSKTINNSVCMSSDNADDRCVTAQAGSALASVTQLPSTGETPIWRNPVLLMMILGSVMSFGGVRMFLLRRRG